MKKKRISVALDLKQYEDFRKIATSRGLSVDRAAGMILADYLNKQKGA